MKRTLADKELYGEVEVEIPAETHQIERRSRLLHQWSNE
jgi:hypothetical protein